VVPGRKYRPSPQPIPIKRRRTWNTLELRGLSWTSLVLHDASAWAVTAMLLTSALALMVDVPVLLGGGAPVGIALATGLFAAGLAAGLAAPLCLLLAALAALVRWIWLQFGRRWAAIVPVLLLSLPVGWMLAMPAQAGHRGGRVLMVATFTAAMVTIVAAGRSRRAWVRNAGAGVLGGVALALDLLLPPTFYREMHDLGCLVTVMAALVVARPLQRRAVAVPAGRVLAALLAGLGFAVTLMIAVDQIAPGWRRPSAVGGRYATRLLALTRTLVDLDRDGFSPIAWGGDCSDLDGRRYPTARDVPGAGDRNCNGIDPPARPTDRQRGLAPAEGDPDLPADGADLVLLVTIDCLRADAVPLVMPRLVEHAARGISFDRMYAAATRSDESMSLIATGAAGPALTAMLEEAGVGVRLIVDDDLPAEPARLSAADVTARALGYLRTASSEPRRHFAWLHYSDARAPAAERLPPTSTEGLRAARQFYLTGLQQIDRELGELLDAVERRGLGDRTVVIITANHGEAFGEHGLVYHDVSGYEEVTHVPAVLLAPGLRPARYPGLTSHRDIYPTVLGAFGLARSNPGSERWGRSWLRLRAAPAAPLHQFVALRTHRYGSGPAAFSPTMALVTSHYKLVKALDEQDLFELFDLEADPGEQVDLAWTQLGLRRSMERDLDTFRDLDRWP
jgi:sulfatase-like protein